MFYASKVENCFETVIAVMAAHIERMEIDAEMKEQANARLREENLALQAERVQDKEVIMKLEERLGKVKDFCAGEYAKHKPLYEFRSRPAEFIKQANFVNAVDKFADAIKPLDSDRDPFDGGKSN